MSNILFNGLLFKIIFAGGTVNKTLSFDEGYSA